MKTSTEIKDLACALAKAQVAFEAAERGHIAKVTSKKGEGSSYSFNYADLAAYLDVCREPLGKNGLSFVQIPTCNGNQVSVVTLLMHESGQFIESDPLTLTLTGETITPQTIGSGITYARRYSLSAITGMASEADDDANAASGNAAQTGKREALPACPQCHKTTSVIKGKDEYGAGLLCFKAKEGCGHSWETDVHPFNDKHKGKKTNGSDKNHAAGGSAPDLVKELNAVLTKCQCQSPDDANAICSWVTDGAVETITVARSAQGFAQAVLDGIAHKGIPLESLLNSARLATEGAAVFG